MTSVSELLSRLRSAGDDGPTARLAQVLVDDALGRPVRELLDPSLVVAAVRDLLGALAASEAATARVVKELEGVRAGLASDPRALGQRLPPALRDAARALARLPLAVRRDAVLKVLDRDALRHILRAQLVEALADFGRRATSPVSDNPIARGLGGLGKLAGQLARPSPLGALASAVSSEVERQVEKRAADFADTAVVGLLSGIADQISDPARAEQQAALRVELLDGILGLTSVELAELGGGSIEAQVTVARGAARALSADAALAARLEQDLARLAAREGDRPLGDLLDDVGLRTPVTRHARAAARQALERLVGGDAFARWLEEAMR